jgi:hypothetical protein
MGRIDSKTERKLKLIDNAYNITRHITDISVAVFLAELFIEPVANTEVLGPCEPIGQTIVPIANTEIIEPIEHIANSTIFEPVEPIANSVVIEPIANAEASEPNVPIVPAMVVINFKNKKKKKKAVPVAPAATVDTVVIEPFVPLGQSIVAIACTSEHIAHTEVIEPVEPIAISVVIEPNANTKASEPNEPIVEALRSFSLVFEKALIPRAPIRLLGRMGFGIYDGQGRLFDCSEDIETAASGSWRPLSWIRQLRPGIEVIVIEPIHLPNGDILDPGDEFSIAHIDADLGLRIRHNSGYVFAIDRDWLNHLEVVEAA